MLRLAFVIITVVGVAGCDRLKGDNPNSCELKDNVGHDGCPDAEPGTGGHCSDSAPCTAEGFPVCDTDRDGGTCVQCSATATDECKGTKPLCVDDKCTGCTKHADCKESDLCLPDGSCALSDRVAYVDGDRTTDGDCTKSSPCTKIEKAAAMKSIVKVTGVVKDQCVITTGTVQIFADPEAKLTTMGGGDAAALDVKGDAKVELHDLQITKLTGNSPGVTLSENAVLTLIHVNVTNNPGRGIDASSGTLTVTRSTISKNIGGGIRMMGPVNFHIIGNVIFGNGLLTKGGAGGLFIGVDVQQPQTLPNEIDFNSISRNSSTGIDVGQGIQCTGGTPVVAKNNIIWNNGIIAAPGLPDSTLLQVNGDGCSYTFSNIGPMGAGTNDGNKEGNPSFVDEAAGNLHLMETSIAKGMANQDADLTGLAAKDIDGETRMKTTDMGADQITRPAP